MIEKVTWTNLHLAPEGTHHLYQGSPFYKNRFLKVLAFHAPGLAPVQLEDHSWTYIIMDGTVFHQTRYKRAFGFYEGIAAVQDNKGFFHTLPNEKPLYHERYAWGGNFQEGCCTVRDFQDNYFHLNAEGKRFYNREYKYAGDFKEGAAVVTDQNGQSTHITPEGTFLHNHWYDELDIFHKGFARAKDERGWFHITRTGTEAYQGRFISLEPFYNGQSYAHTHDHRAVIINEKGQEILEIDSKPQNLLGDISQSYVHFWHTKTLDLAFNLKIFDLLPTAPLHMAKHFCAAPEKMQRLLAALGEMGLVEEKEKEWHLTPKGYFVKDHLKDVHFMWKKVEREWDLLQETVLSLQEIYHPSFKETEPNQEIKSRYENALNTYALHDFKDLIKWPLWSTIPSLGAMGKTGQFLLSKMDRDNMTSQSPQPLLDAFLIVRFLHCFPDSEALMRLQEASASLKPQGKLYIFETLRCEKNYAGSLFDLNMLIETGGKVRTEKEFRNLLSNAGFTVTSQTPLYPHLTLIEASK